MSSIHLPQNTDKISCRLAVLTLSAPNTHTYALLPYIIRDVHPHMGFVVSTAVLGLDILRVFVGTIPPMLQTHPFLHS
jgi:hypothetical protein